MDKLKRPITRFNPPVYNKAEKGREERYDKRVKLHPILSSIKGMYRPESTFEILNTRKNSSYGRVRVSSLTDIIDQPATKPPCDEVELSYSSIRPDDSEDDYIEDGDEEDEDEDTPSMLFTTIEGDTDETGVRQPITVKQFIKGHLEAIRAEPDAEGSEIECWIFIDWATKYIDKNGCLHLSQAMWYRADVGMDYKEGSDGEYRRASEDSRRGGESSAHYDEEFY